MKNNVIIPQKSKEVQVSSDDAFRLDKEIKTFRMRISKDFWSLTSMLKQAREWRIWAVLGCESWEAYLAQPEIDLNPKTVDNYLTIYNSIKDIQKLPLVGVNDIDIGKLAIIAPHINEENAEQLIEKAKTLSRSDLRKEIQEEKFKQLPKSEVPKDRYEVIVIDPPWPYGTVYDPETRRVGNPYPEMSLDEIAQLPIPAADNSVIWLWTTHKFIPHSFDLLEQWGFEYKLTFVWDKQRMGMGYWLRCQVEFCLLGVKGKPRWYLENERDILSVARRQHSRKPDEFYGLVERLMPDTKKIDFFSREKRDGWDQYGNEPDKF